VPTRGRHKVFFCSLGGARHSETQNCSFNCFSFFSNSEFCLSLLICKARANDSLPARDEISRRTLPNVADNWWTPGLVKPMGDCLPFGPTILHPLTIRLAVVTAHDANWTWRYSLAGFIVSGNADRKTGIRTIPYRNCLPIKIPSSEVRLSSKPLHFMWFSEQRRQNFSTWGPRTPQGNFLFGSKHRGAQESRAPVLQGVVADPRLFAQPRPVGWRATDFSVGDSSRPSFQGFASVALPGFIYRSETCPRVTRLFGIQVIARPGLRELMRCKDAPPKHGSSC